MDVLVGDLVVEHRRDGVGLADLLGLEALALEHVQEVGVAAEVQLVRAVDAHAAVHEQAGQHAVRDRGADLALDVVADDRQALLGEPALPVGLTADEHRDRVDEPDARLERLLDVPLRGLLAPDREVGDDHVDLALAQDADDVGRGAGGLLDDLGQVLAQAVVGHPAVDLDAEVRHVHELVGVVLAREDRLGQVLADLLLVDVERRHELHVADVVVAQLDVHQPRDEVAGLGVLVVVAALDEAARAVADAHDGDADLLAARLGLVVAVLAVLAHVLLLHVAAVTPVPASMPG